jgi:hypothetical protein
MSDAVQIGQVGEIHLQVASVLAARDLPYVKDHNVAHPHDYMLGVCVPDPSVSELLAADFFE